MSNRKYRTASLDGLAKLALQRRGCVYYCEKNRLHSKWLKAGFVRLERIPWGSRNRTIIVLTDKGWMALRRRARSLDTRFRLHGALHYLSSGRSYKSRSVDLHTLNMVYENCSDDDFYNNLIGIIGK